MSDLIVVDEYYAKMGEYFKKKGQHLENIGEEYLLALKQIRMRGICSGETADALDAYIELGEKLKECALRIGNSAAVIAKTYVDTIDRKDQYLF